MVDEFESNDMEHVCAAVRHHYLVSDLNYHVSVSHNKTLHFDPILSQRLKVGSPPPL